MCPGVTSVVRRAETSTACSKLEERATQRTAARDVQRAGRSTAWRNVGVSEFMLSKLKVLLGGATGEKAIKADQVKLAPISNNLQRKDSKG